MTVATLQNKQRAVNLLLIEDNRGDAVLVARAFRSAATPLHIITAETAEKALSILRQEGEYETYPRPDFMLLDLNLPGMHGHEFLAIVKADPRFKHIPVIILSSSRAKQDVVDSYLQHANSYLVKPVGVECFDDMTAAIERFLIKTITLPDATDI